MMNLKLKIQYQIQIFHHTVLYKFELEDFAKLCKILDTTNYLTNISEEQMNEVREIVSINKVVD